MTQLLQSYLFAYLFWLGVALGSFALLAIHGLTGGRWGEAIRAPLLAMIGTIPLFAVLFLPLLLGVKLIFPWTAQNVGSRAAYLNVPFFAIRAAIYFACWIALALATLRRRAVPLPGPSLILYAVTMTFAAWDWMMSLEPKWWSTIYAMNVISGQALTALAAAVAIVTFFAAADAGAMPDLANLLLAAIMFWAYLTFSQFLVIWSGNGKEEIAWYLSRIETSWKWPAAALIVFAFFAPFLVLLFRSAKRNPAMMFRIAAFILVTRVIDVFWTIAPAFHPRGVFVSVWDVIALLGLGAAWWTAFRWRRGAMQTSAQGV
jgi:hypothetical protein